MHHPIDLLAYTNQLRSLPPEHKLGFAAALFVLGYLAPAPVQALIVVWLFIWVVKYAQVPAQTYLQLLFLPFSFLLLSLPALIGSVGAVSHLPHFAPDVVWGIPIRSVYFYLSRQGIEQAKGIFVRSMALTSCFYFILLTVPMVEIIRILNRLGCPVVITELMGLMYRFIFMLTDTARELLAAQQARFGYRSWGTGIRSLSILAGQLLRRTLSNYQQLSLGLAARGYTGEVRVWHRRRYRFNWRYTTEAIAGYFLLLALTGFHYCSAWDSGDASFF